MAASGADTAAFDPALDPTAFRRALGSFVTGVTVVTTDTADGPIGITANSFASLSLDPPLILWSPARASRRHPHFVAADHFAVHILGSDQRAVCEAFVRSKHGFDGLDWTANADGVPIIAGAAAVFECSFQAAHPAGDHDIVIGLVTRAHQTGAAPLVFHAGRYHDFGPSAD